MQKKFRLATLALLLFLGFYTHTNSQLKVVQDLHLASNSLQKESFIALAPFVVGEILQQDLVDYYLRVYLKDRQFMTFLKRANPYIEDVIAKLDHMNLPRELALLPMVESGYVPAARSHAGAVGIWQISKITGKRYGIVSGSKDLRQDFTASTDVALAYLKFLYHEFNQDWLLALAAYNAGEGRVKQSIKRCRKKRPSCLSIYWDLSLPSETKHFVPKMLALSIIFKQYLRSS